MEPKTGNAVDLADKIRLHKDFWAGTRGTGPLIERSTYGSLGEMHLLLRDGSVASPGLRLEAHQLEGRVLARAETATGAATMLIATTRPWADVHRDNDAEGDAIPVVAPMTRIPWVEAILGCPIVVGEESIWSKPWLDSPTDSDAVRSWRENPWLSKLLEITAALVETWDEPVQATQTLMRGPTDLLAALVGNEKMVYVLADEPGACHVLLEVCTEAFIEIARAQFNLIPRLAGGHVSMFGIWAPGTVVRTQCDASALIGHKWYEERIVPFETRICEAFDHSIIHLHSGYLFTVDALLKLDALTAIQVAIDPGSFGPPPTELLPVFKKILDRKALLIEGRLTEREFDTLVRELPREGLFIGAAIAGEGDPP